MSSKRRLLLIDDDPIFRQLAARSLEEAGFDVSEADGGAAGLEAVAARPPDLVVLDVVMPVVDGLEVCRKLKADPRTAGIPIIVLTGDGREGQEIVLLDQGADDYQTKPVDFSRLAARVRAVLRRDQRQDESRPIRTIGPLTLDYDSRSVEFQGRTFQNLTPREFDVLYELARVAPRAVRPADLYRRLWSAEPPSEGSLKTVKVHVQRIRLKLGPPIDGWIVHLSGRGYGLRCPAEARATQRTSTSVKKSRGARLSVKGRKPKTLE